MPKTAYVWLADDVEMFVIGRAFTDRECAMSCAPCVTKEHERALLLKVVVHGAALRWTLCCAVGPFEERAELLKVSDEQIGHNLMAYVAGRPELVEDVHAACARVKPNRALSKVARLFKRL